MHTVEQTINRCARDKYGAYGEIRAREKRNFREDFVMKRAYIFDWLIFSYVSYPIREDRLAR
jgi:hypothetical protein